MLIETNNIMTYNFLYKLLELILIDTPTTTSVERVFSSMNFVKKQAMEQNIKQLFSY
jgi:hypothetical protein